MIPILPFLADEFEASSAQLGLLFSIYSFASVPGGLIIGSIVSRYLSLPFFSWCVPIAASNIYINSFVLCRFGTKAAIIFSMTGSALSLLGCALAQEYYQVLIARAIGGVAGNSLPAVFIFIGFRIPLAKRAKYMSYASVIIMVSVMLGPLMGGALSVYGIRTPFFAAAGVAALGLGVTLLFMTNLIPPQKPSNSGASAKLTTQNKLTLVLAFIYALPYSAEITLCGQVYTQTDTDTGTHHNTQTPHKHTRHT